MQISQCLSFPFNTEESTAVQNAYIRLLTPSPSSNSPLFAMTTPVDKTAAVAEGSSIWRFDMKSWPEQIDELVLAGKYSDALAYLNTLDDEQLVDKVRE